MTIPPPDGSRDRRIEDPSNLWIIHPLGRMLLPVAVARGISANSVSILGLCLGAGAALSYAHWPSWTWALVGLALSIGWLIADGLDGMIARATGTASALGRTLDGLCDHGVFVLIYVALALTIGTLEGWILAVAAGIAHAVQSSLYEGERSRFHRRNKGRAMVAPSQMAGSNPATGALVRAYDSVAGSLDRVAMRFENILENAADPADLGRRYGSLAASPLHLMALLTANVRVATVFIACVAGNPRIFWWVEIVPLTIVAAIGMAWHRRVERAFVAGSYSGAADDRSAMRSS